MPLRHHLGELAHHLDAGAHARLHAGQREPVAAEGDLDVQAVLQVAQHAVLLARQLDGHPVVELDDLIDAPGGAHMLNDSVPPPMTCQCM